MFTWLEVFRERVAALSIPRSHTNSIWSLSSQTAEPCSALNSRLQAPGKGSGVVSFLGGQAPLSKVKIPR